MKISEYIVKRIEKEKIEYIFGYQGSNVAPIIDCIDEKNKVMYVSLYNEQSASYAACGYAQDSEKIGVAIASSGPGAINMISGIANAFYDSIPCIFITGNVSTCSLKKSPKIRQNAFQENDIVQMTKSITKFSATVRDADSFQNVFEKAIEIAKDGRPGPVLIDIPYDIQNSDIKIQTINKKFSKPNSIKLEVIYEINQTLKKSKRPLIIVGGGAKYDEIKKLIKQFNKKWNIPIVATLRGIDVIPNDSKLYMGFGGAYGLKKANYAIYYADTILVLGSRLDERFIYCKDKKILEKKKVIHVDIDKSELKRVVKNEISINASLDSFLREILKTDAKSFRNSRWIKDIEEYGMISRTKDIPTNMGTIINKISKLIPKTSILTFDVGINQMCCAQNTEISCGQKCYTSSGLGAMGSSLPLAIGASFASKRKHVYCFVGDGGIHMNIQELLMVSKHNLPITVIIINNQCLGMIKDFQEKKFESRFIGTVNEFCAINYRKIAKSYSLEYFKISNKTSVNKISEIMKLRNALVEVFVPGETQTNPEIEDSMFDFLGKVEYEG